MSKSTLIFIIIIILAVAGFVYYVQYYQFLPEKRQMELKATKIEEPALIRYTDSGYMPSNLIVKKGTAVIFKNESSQETWPASAMHPTHAAYPTTGGCTGSTFDACRGLKQGESWIFTFDIPGTWKYHDHLNPKHFGSITVE